MVSLTHCADNVEPRTTKFFYTNVHKSQFNSMQTKQHADKNLDSLKQMKKIFFRYPYMQNRNTSMDYTCCCLQKQHKDSYHLSTTHHLLLVGQQDETCGVIIEDTHTVVTQLVTKAVLVRIVHPLADPIYGYASRVHRFICKTARADERHGLTCEQRPHM